MRPEPIAEGRRWVDQARRDIDDARFAADGGRDNLACFLAQQAAEKALKGFLYASGEESVWGHSVADLCDRAGEKSATLRALVRSGASLDVYYIPTRYPNGLPGGLPADAFGADDAARAIERATEIIEAVEKTFPS
jgi:HEPN domain-containing protein